MPGVLRGADGSAGPSSGRVLPDADGGIPGRDRVGAGHRVAVQGLDLGAGVSGLWSGEDAAGAFHALEDAQAAESGGPRGGVRLGAGTAAGVGAAARQDGWGGRGDGTEYDAWLEQLVRASGIETPTRQDLAKLDRKRPKEVVADKGYQSNATMTGVKERGKRCYVSEPRPMIEHVGHVVVPAPLLPGLRPHLPHRRPICPGCRRPPAASAPRAPGLMRLCSTPPRARTL